MKPRKGLNRRLIIALIWIGKNFFKPTIGKIVLFLILIFGFTYWEFIQNSYTDTPIKLVGLPLAFLPVGTYGTGTPVEFSIINFVINILFWYLASAIIIEVYRKVRKK